MSSIATMPCHAVTSPAPDLPRLQAQLRRYAALADYNKPLSIVVADDEKRLLDLIAMSVEFLGHKVVARCRSGAEALEKCAELDPDLAIMDVNMPGGDGIDAATVLERELALPVIISTGLTDSKTLARVTALQIKAYLVKPFSPAQLKSSLGIVIAQHRRDLAARCGHAEWAA